MFRIDYVLPRCSDTPLQWQWSVKVPDGLYETLVTNDMGCGLYIRRLTGSPDGSLINLTKLLAEDEFFIPENVTKDQSIDLLERALVKLGWDQDFIVLLKHV